MFVGAERGEGLADGHADRLFPRHHPYEVVAVLDQRGILLRVDDTGFVDLVQPACNHFDIFLRQSRDAASVCVSELVDILLLDRRADVEVWLEMLHHRVALRLQSLFGLEDGEVEFGYQLPVHPGFALVIVEELAPCAGKEKHDQHHGHDDQCRPRNHVAPIVMADVSESNHYCLRFVNVQTTCPALMRQYANNLRKY